MAHIFSFETSIADTKIAFSGDLAFCDAEKSTPKRAHSRAELMGTVISTVGGNPSARRGLLFWKENDPPREGNHRTHISRLKR